MPFDNKKKGGFALTIAAGIPKGMGKKPMSSDEEKADQDEDMSEDDKGMGDEKDMEKAGDALADALDSGVRGKDLISALREAIAYC